MNLQDFACACSDLMWGGELGWDRKNGLVLLFNTMRKKIKRSTGMTKSTELIRDLGAKLKEDVYNFKKRDPEGDLYYVMEINLEDVIRDTAFELGFKDPEAVMDLSAKASQAFLGRLIELSDKYNKYA